MIIPVDCKECSLARDGIKPVPGEGSPTAQVAFVGRDPGADENIAGRPFIGAGGRKLREFIKRVFGDEQSVYITNMVKCHTENNVGPTDSEMGICSVKYLMRELLEIHPVIVFTLGLDASRRLIATRYPNLVNKKLSEMVGTCYPIRINGFIIYVMPCYHPSPRNFQYYDDIEETLKRGKDFLIEFNAKKA